jgi:hypothetical protein
LHRRRRGRGAWRRMRVGPHGGPPGARAAYMVWASVLEAAHTAWSRPVCRHNHVCGMPNVHRTSTQPCCQTAHLVPWSASLTGATRLHAQSSLVRGTSSVPVAGRPAKHSCTYCFAAAVISA